MTLWIGNAVALIGCLLMVATGFITKKEKVLPLQCLQFGIQGIANLILGGVSGFICNAVGILRNLVFFKGKSSRFLKVFFILLQAALTFLFDGFALPVWLPILSAVVFTWFIDAKNPAVFKIAMTVGQVLWLAYDVIYQNYVSVAFDSFSTIANLIALVSILRSNNRPAA